jgi:hypothetical protein
VRRYWLISAALLAGCVEGFGGSNVQIDLGPATPAQAPVARAPQPGRELPPNVHFRLYAVMEAGNNDSLIELQRFEVHKLVDPTSPCFIDVGPNVPFPGLHVSQYANKTSERTGITDITNPPAGATREQQIEQATAVQRMRNVMVLAGDTGLKAVTSASPGGYPAVDADCDGTSLPPPTCIDDASNARRLQICRATWASDPQLFEGTDRVLTSPLSGTTFGFVPGLNPVPVTPVPVGGAQFFISDALAGVAEYAVYFQADDATDLGTLFLSGSPLPGSTRGVTHVHMTSPFLPIALAEANLAIFTDLDQDDVSF